MKKKHMTKRQYARYKKTYRYAHPVDAEKGKVKRETSNYTKYRRKSDDKKKRLLRDVAMGDSYELLDDEDDFFDEYEFKATKEIGNAGNTKKESKSWNCMKVSNYVSGKEE